jgi:hypothetical protein
MRPFSAKERDPQLHVPGTREQCLVHEMYHGNPGGEVVGGQCCQLLVRFSDRLTKIFSPLKIFVLFVDLFFS